MVLLWYAASTLLCYCRVAGSPWPPSWVMWILSSPLPRQNGEDMWESLWKYLTDSDTDAVPPLWLHRLWEWVALQIGALRRNACHWLLDNVLTRPTVCYPFIHRINHLCMFEEHHWHQNCHSTPFATHKLFAVGYIIQVLNIMYLSSA